MGAAMIADHCARSGVVTSSMASIARMIGTWMILGLAASSYL
jgi:hypothetical protein